MLLGLVATLAVMLPAVPASHGRDSEVRASGVCGGGATTKIAVKRDDGALEVEFELEHSRTRGSAWRLVLVHEGRVEWRGRARPRGPRGSFEITRRVRDLPGADRVMVRATGPRGLSCSASATLRR